MSDVGLSVLVNVRAPNVKRGNNRSRLVEGATARTEEARGECRDEGVLISITFTCNKKKTEQKKLDSIQQRKYHSVTLYLRKTKRWFSPTERGETRACVCSLLVSNGTRDEQTHTL